LPTRRRVRRNECMPTRRARTAGAADNNI
jgi:hypothetical protein